MKFIDLDAQHKLIKNDIDDAINKVLDHKHFIIGPEVHELEVCLANYVGVNHCITVSSGTDALLIAMMSLGIGQGDEVITTPFTFVSTSEMIVLLGASRSLLSALILENNISDSELLLQKVQKSFKDNIYLEIQRHNESHEQALESQLLNFSEKLSIPIIATHEVFYLKKDMYEAHDAYICVGQKTYVNDIKRLRYSEEHYFKSDSEMTELFSDLPDFPDKPAENCSSS